MKTNEELQNDVQDAIKWEPLLHAAEIGVIAKDGVVMLTGVVDIYAKKIEAENAAKHVTGVKAVVEEIKIKTSNSWDRSNADIANEVLNALKGRWDIPNDKVKVKVEDGWITLEGELQWNYQKTAAKDAIINHYGVKGITNNITIKPEFQKVILQKEVEQEFARNWSINRKDIKVIVSGTKITLSGEVSSWYQKDEAEKIAWKTPGVCTVDNRLVIEYDYSYAD